MEIKEANGLLKGITGREVNPNPIIKKMEKRGLGISENICRHSLAFTLRLDLDRWESWAAW